MIYGKLVNVGDTEASFKLKNGKIITLMPDESYIIGRLAIGDIIFYKQLKNKKLVLKKSTVPFEAAITYVAPIITLEVEDHIVSEREKVIDMSEEVEVEEIEAEKEVKMLENLNEPFYDYDGLTKAQIAEKLRALGIPFKDYENKRALFDKLIGK